MNKKPISGNLAALPRTESKPTHGKTSPNHDNDTSQPPTRQSPSTASAAANAASPCRGNDVPRHGSVQMVFDQILPDLAPTGVVREPLLTKTQLAMHYQVSGRTVQRWVASEMPFVWVGKRQKRFQLSQVQLWLQQNHINRFASQGIATTMTELRRRVVNIPILNGLQILQSHNNSLPGKAHNPQPKPRK